MSTPVVVTPRIGIVVVSFNTRSLLRDCLASIAGAPFPTRVVVVDNASSDGTTAMVRDDFPSVELVANDTNRGFAAATNQGLAGLIDHSDFILLLNPDAALCPGALEHLVNFMLAHPRVGVCSPRLQYPDGRPQAGAFRFPTLAMAFLDLFPPRGPLLGRLYDSYLNGRYPEERGVEAFPIDHPLGAAMLIRSETLSEVGPLDEHFWLYAEEVDWCLRCHRAGWAIWQVPAARVVHVAGASSSQFRSASFVALHRARARFVHKWHTPFYRNWYARIIRLGMVASTLTAWRDWWRGRLQPAELRGHLSGYAAVFRLVAEGFAPDSDSSPARTMDVPPPF